MALHNIALVEGRNAVWVIYRCIRCGQMRKFMAFCEGDKFTFTDGSLKTLSQIRERVSRRDR